MAKTPGFSVGLGDTTKAARLESFCKNFAQESSLLDAETKKQEDEGDLTVEQGNEEITSDLQCQGFPKEPPDVFYESPHVNGCLTEEASSPDRETGKQLPLTQRSGPL